LSEPLTPLVRPVDSGEERRFNEVVEARKKMDCRGWVVRYSVESP